MSDNRLTVAEIARFWRDLAGQAPQPIAWTITIPMDVYRQLWTTRSPMARKIARLAQSPARPRPRARGHREP